MPKYQCPECEAVLKRDLDVTGKKIRCPKCESVFRAEPMRDAATERKPASTKRAPADDEETGGTYGVAAEPEPAPDAQEDDSKKKKKKEKDKEINYGSLRDKFEKSKRGPATARLVKPCNAIIMIGIVTCVASIIGVMVFLWPFIFSESMPRGKAARNGVLGVIGMVLLFGVGCLTCHGAYKMQTLESLPWAWASTILSIVVGVGAGGGGIFAAYKLNDSKEEGDLFMTMIVMALVGVSVLIGSFAGGNGARTIMALKDEEIIEGFEETQSAREY